ncbi:hypothetical protein HDV00_003565 [Rhizophlyctis rosea]|nr:hypothetical protein HDV00_003565 [Rhizophlyctis rosea]
MPRIHIDDVEPLTTPLSSNQSGIDRAKELLPTAEAFSHKDATFIPVKHGMFGAEGRWSETLNPFMSAATMSFATHRPLQLTPDIIYNLILQGISAHVATNPEKYRSVLVSHNEGKVELRVRDDSLVPGNWSNNWGYSVQEFRTQIVQRIPPNSPATPALNLSFTTTTPTNHIAHSAVLMDVVKAFYTYTIMTMCGIPWIDITGTKEDWIALSQALDKSLPSLELGDWNNNLQQILANIISVYEGNTDTTFWKQFYYYQGPRGSGGVAKIDGWIARLFLYVKNGINSLASSQQPVQDPATASDRYDPFGRGPGIPLADFPIGVTDTPIKWEYLGKAIPMTLRAGMVGVTVNEDGVLCPQVGWVIGKDLKGKEM